MVVEGVKECLWLEGGAHLPASQPLPYPYAKVLAMQGILPYLSLIRGKGNVYVVQYNTLHIGTMWTILNRTRYS